MKTILLLIGNFPGPASACEAPKVVGGAELQAQRVVERLATRFNVYVIAGWQPGDPPVDARHDITVRRVGLIPHDRPSAIAGCLRGLAAGVAAPRPDTVQGFQLGGNALAAAGIAMLRGAPLVLKIAHRDDLEDMGAPRRRLMKAFLLRRAAAIVTPSQAVMDVALAAGVPQAKLHYIPNGVDTAHFRPPTAAEREAVRAPFGYTDQDFVFLWSARMTATKRLADLAAAWPALAARCPEARLLIVGRGPEEHIAGALVAAFPRTVSVHPFEEDVRRLLWAADTFLMTTRAEGLSNSLLEALACGLVCLVSDAPENVEVAAGQDFLWTYPRGAVHDLVDGMQRSIEGRDTAAARARAGRRRIEEGYGLDVTVERWAELYHHLAGDPCP